MHKSSSEKKPKIEMCADDQMHELCGIEYVYEWVKERKLQKKHCVAANRSTFDSIIISKITLVKSNFSIEKVPTFFVVLGCVNAFVRHVVIHWLILSDFRMFVQTNYQIQIERETKYSKKGKDADFCPSTLCGWKESIILRMKKK